MQDGKCETVEVVSSESPCGFVIINKSDYDPDVHEIFGAKQVEKNGVKKGKK